LATLLLSTLFACTTPSADYEVTLLPAFLASQREEVLAREPVVKLIVRYEDGEQVVYLAGDAVDGEPLPVPGLPPVPAGTILGLALEEAGAGAAETWNREHTIAYGEVAVPQELAVGGVQLELSVVVLRLDAVARLGKLDEAARVLAGAPAVAPDGTAYVFGGGDPDASDTNGQGVGRGEILRLERTADGWSAPRVLGVELPEFTYTNFAEPPITTTDVAGSVAVTVETAAGPRIFVFGGRASQFSTGYNGARFLEFDPTEDKLVGNGGEMEVGRSHPLVLPLGANKLLLFGGTTNAVLQNHTYELFTISSRSSVLSTHNLDVQGNFGGYGTTLANGAAVCAGAFGDVSTYGLTLVPVDQCFIVSANDDFDEIAPLPAPTYGASIAELADGGLLVTGGAPDILDLDPATPEIPADVPATTSAYRWSPATDDWVEVGPLRAARAHHRSVALPDGRVLIVGGSERAAHLYAATGAAVTQTELFDPATDTFVITSDSTAGSGADPGLSGPEGGPWLVVEGTTVISVPGLTVGGAAYGMIGGQPGE
jgi:hypothetical protein